MGGLRWGGRPRKPIELHQIVLNRQRRRVRLDQGRHLLGHGDRIAAPGANNAELLIERGKLALLDRSDMRTLRSQAGSVQAGGQIRGISTFSGIGDAGRQRRLFLHRGAISAEIPDDLGTRARLRTRASVRSMGGPCQGKPRFRIGLTFQEVPKSEPPACQAVARQTSRWALTQRHPLWLY